MFRLGLLTIFRPSQGKLERIGQIEALALAGYLWAPSCSILDNTGNQKAVIPITSQGFIPGCGSRVSQEF